MTYSVAPRVGAWIEILQYPVTRAGNESLPVWERGLKSLETITRRVGHGRSPCGSVD